MKRWAVLALFLASPLSADEAAIEQAWRNWVDETGATESTLAIIKDREVIAEFGIGVPADAPVPLASLSKAITGACILSLIEEGAFQSDTTLDALLADRPDILGNGEQITIEQLLTHTSGLSEDSTQSLLNPTLWGGTDMHDQFASLALSRPVGEPKFSYNNENYAILGAVIMEVTGETVEGACASRVLNDLGSAGPSSLTGGSLAWGGWEMSVSDYGRFVSSLTITDDWPRTPLGGTAYYGPGMFIRETETGAHIWHFGGFCVIPALNHGSYFNVLDNGWGVVVSYNICAKGEQSRALDNSLARAQMAQ